jgi:hypothetical protein
MPTALKKFQTFMKKLLCIIAAAALLCGCASVPPPIWNAITPEREAEYQPFLKTGDCILTGQAFLVQENGHTIQAAGRIVTLDPANSIGKEWWVKDGKSWRWKDLKPPTPEFDKARRTTIADADGRFKFTDLPAGDYFIRTEVTWDVVSVDSITGYPFTSTQGGLLGRLIEVTEKPNEVILSDLAN